LPRDHALAQTAEGQLPYILAILQDHALDAGVNLPRQQIEGLAGIVGGEADEGQEQRVAGRQGFEAVGTLTWFGVKAALENVAVRVSVSRTSVVV
jgi:hypothetical protein